MMSANQITTTTSFENANWINRGTNWPSYKFQTESFAYGIDAEKILNGTEERPSSNAESWDTRNRKLYHYISKTQSVETLMHIQHVPLGDTPAAWKSLLNFFESQTRAAIKQQASKIITLKQRDFPGVPEFLHDLVSRMSQLKQALEDKKVDLLDILGCSILLDGLDSDYSTVATTLLLQDDLSFTQCQAKVLEACERVKREKEEFQETMTPTIHAMRAAMQQAAKHHCAGCHKEVHHTIDKCWTLHPHLKRNAWDDNKRGESKPAEAKFTRNAHPAQQFSWDSDAW